jgi:hypothetical protein
VARLNAKYTGVAAADMPADLLAGELESHVAAVSSFGSEYRRAARSCCRGGQGRAGDLHKHGFFRR